MRSRSPARATRSTALSVVGIVAPLPACTSAPPGHAAHGQVIHRHRVAATAAAESADRQRALREREDLSVGSAKRRRQQRAALQAARIADRRRGDVEARAGARIASAAPR